MKIGLKLTLSFFAIAFLACLIIGILSYRTASDSLEKESFNKLTAVREMKAGQIEDYFGQITQEIRTFSEDPTFINAMKDLGKGFHQVDKDLGIDDKAMDTLTEDLGNYFNNTYLKRLNANLQVKATVEDEMSPDKNCRILQDLYIVHNPNPVGSKLNLDSSADKSYYSKVHKHYHPVIRDYLEKFGYYDVFLVDPKGNIVYTCFKEVDFGTSLLDGPFRETNLADAFRVANASNERNFVQLVDFRPYHPSYNAPASFIASPIFDGDEKIGVLIFQIPIDRINDIMTNKQGWTNVGLGNSGETYLVGEDFTLRNQSRFLIEDSTNYYLMIKEIGLPDATIDKIKNFHSSIGLQVVKTQGTIAALQGKTEQKIFPDYRGVPVLSAYKPLNIPCMHWVIMSEIDEKEAFEYVHSLRDRIIIAFSIMVLLIIIVSYFISRKITRPLNILTNDAVELAKGNFDVQIGIKRKDEIGILALSFRKMQLSIKRLVEELREINQGLEQKVLERTQEIQHQKEMVEEKNKEILDSINYALRLQRAILPGLEKVKEKLPDSFILYKPKDIVSGDFYWMYDSSESAARNTVKSKGGEFSGYLNGDGKLLIAAVDCTGHGVPGAMVSVMGANGLNRCVKEFGLIKPSDIMDKLTDLIIETFDASDSEVKDGMDMSLLAIDKKTRKIEFCGANNPLWVVRKATGTVEEIKADKQPIGKFDFRRSFTNHSIQLGPGDCIYIFTDGFADQFGGPKGKKFKYKTLQTVLLGMRDKPMQEQRDTLDMCFEEWKGALEQVDDVCVIGIRF
ncbi:MAG TPA: SpoIIE family protein phosphatase [Bacteroidia bacterium]|jgi:serine phosphatase RsbU (regulator of sigma subunit)